ncbi:MAG: hypothetical protein HYW80_01610 [Parcubacteria group bacterium]|nr:hypothetical protein [Parcubacteria group bacterium]
MAWYRNLEDFMNANGYVINGEWFPRVTSIVTIKSKPALYKFYGDASSFGEGMSISRKSATEGTKTHDAVEAILRGESPVIEPDIRPALLAFQRFLQQNTIIATSGAIEKRIWHPRNRYAGTVDAVVHLNGKPGVLDIKTSSGIWRDYNLQTSAYLAALQDPEPWENITRHPVETRWILRIDQAQICQKCGAKRRLKGGRETIKNSQGRENCSHVWGETAGECELKELPDFEKDFQAFLAAKTLWEWENEYWLKQIGY